MSTTSAPATGAPRPPTPRRVRVGPTAWGLLRDAARREVDLARPDRLPDLPRDPAATDHARAALVHHDLLTEDGRPAPPVLAGLRVLAGAPVTVVLDRRTGAGRVEAAWATAGLPTAGVVVIHRQRDDGRVDVEVELQLLAGDDVADAVVSTLGLPPAHRDADAADTGVVDLLDAATSLPAPLDDVVVDGRPSLHAVVQVSGPLGTRVATVVGDGARTWQVGARDRTTLAWHAVEARTVHASLVAALAAQVGVLGGARRG